MNYPDVPSAEAYMPNINEAWTRAINFGSYITTQKVDLAGQEAALENDLTTIFNKYDLTIRLKNSMYCGSYFIR